MSRLLQLFWHADQRRVRAVWRLAIHGVAMGVIGVALSMVLWPLLAHLPDSGSSGIPGLGAAIFSLAVVGLSVWLCARTLDKRRFDDLGFHFDLRWWLDFGAGAGLGVALMATIFALEWALGWVRVEGTFVGAAPGQPFALALLLPFLVFVCVAVYEELFSRGYHLRNMAEGLYELGGQRRKLGPGAALTLAALVSAGIFGLLHAGNPSASWISTLNIALAGCMLAVGPALTGELGFAIGLHLTWNFCQGNVFGFPVSGTDAGPRILAITQGGDPLITGGDFGPEAGLIGAAACLIGAAATMAWIRLTRGPRRDPSGADALASLVEAPEST